MTYWFLRQLKSIMSSPTIINSCQIH
uniref:Uncharacterized protein n=1 Tax=Arundo donax TaxID=35708 RepID=A0A0A8YBR4_ARUDO